MGKTWFLNFQGNYDIFSILLSSMRVDDIMAQWWALKCEMVDVIEIPYAGKIG